MMKINRLFQAMATALALAGGAWFACDAVAADRVVLKDGKVVEGKITKELDGYIWIEETLTGVKQPPKMYKPDEIDKVERDAASTPATEAGKAVASDVAIKPILTTPKKAGGKVPKGAVITLGDEVNGHMVGVYMTAKPLLDAIPYLEKELDSEEKIVVLRFHSGGGMLLEIQKLSDAIHNEYKPRFRTVAWIDTAISAAAMTAHCIDEIYFAPNGNYGACTGFYGSLDRPVEGLELQKVLHQMEKISARGGWDFRIMRAMQIQDALSAHIDENGKVNYFSDISSGDIVVNREKEILTFNPESALAVKFSRGTAANLDELTKLMGYQEIEWVGEQVSTVPWPVSKGEKIQMDYRKKVKEDEVNTNRYFTEFRSAIATAQSMQTRERRAPFVGKARQALEKIKAMVANNPNFKITVFQMDDEEWKEQLEKWDKLLRDLMR